MFVQEKPKLGIIFLPLLQARLILRVVPSDLCSNSPDEHIRNHLRLLGNVVLTSSTIWAATATIRTTSVAVITIARTAVG